ncbi:hypothetical protein BD410DRAFT_785317, partial [Rickenella mellea]
MLELSLGEFMKALELLGIAVVDKSVSGKIKRKGRLPIDPNTGPIHMMEKSVKVAITISEQFLRMEEHRRAESWMKAAAHRERIHFLHHSKRYSLTPSVEHNQTGGGVDLFELRYQLVLER